MNFDYIIIGAGVIGSSTAFYLKSALPGSRILLIDRNHTAGNTAKSAALYRNFFSSQCPYVLCHLCPDGRLFYCSSVEG
jgi:glycine/D-amino acid oxidase-like deaminating enzyme